MSKLDYPQLPSREEYYNALKDEHMTPEQYSACQAVRLEHEMTFTEYLIWYNNLDVGPFVMGIERWLKIVFRPKY